MSEQIFSVITPEPTRSDTPPASDDSVRQPTRIFTPEEQSLIDRAEAETAAIQKGRPIDACSVDEQIKILQILRTTAASAGLIEMPASSIESLAELFESPTFVSLPAIPAFVARTHFTIDTSEEAKVKIRYLDDDFKKNFLTKTEAALPASQLAIRKLKKSSPSGPIREALGESQQTTMGQLFEMLKKQSKGEAGALLNNGSANLFYIPDEKGQLWALDAYRSGGGWHVNSNSVEDSSSWRVGYQVVSRDF